MGRIVARGLGKKFRIYRRSRDQLLEWMSRGGKTLHREDWVLRDIDFEVNEGESVGIIGMNGAGKSTLLRILTGTTLASEGSFEVSGRVAALLELGLGIHPEFDGWQNAGLACRLLGVEEHDIPKVLPWVQEFSELGSHMDQPVRTYSTGMQVRLAFSAATAVRPDVLMVDEALSVGDAYFQHKSMSRIRAFREEGTTLLFVTHDPGAVKSLCDRALLLEAGRLVLDDAPDAVFDYYNARIAQREKDAEIEQHKDSEGRSVTRSGTREAELVSVTVEDGEGRPARLFRVGAAATIRCRIKLNAAMDCPTVGFVIRDRLGSDVFGSNTFHLDVGGAVGEAGELFEAEFRTVMHLGPGTYSLSVALHRDHVHVESNYDWWDRAALIEVVPGENAPFTGLAALPIEGTVRRRPSGD
ncbi:MAG: ABC transporter ATP-binding protein [Candidatus Binatia bacterium]|nr:ABC transporter ATP-binding protein [Candidatus Binatia bacterium]